MPTTSDTPTRMNIRDFFKGLQIRWKLVCSYATVFVLTITLGGIISYTFVRRSIEATIENELRNGTATILNLVKTAADVSIKNHLRALAEKNREIVDGLYQAFREGRLSEADARDRAREILLSQTIGKTGYIYCLDRTGIIRIHPKRELLGADLSEYAFIRDQQQRRDGYLEYDWQNPGESHPRPKALYMSYFEPWDWIISVSSYRSEFTEVVNVADFQDVILSLQFGQTGYSYVMDSRGTLVIHPKLSGSNIFDSRDEQGNRFVEEMCRRKSGKIIYSWKNPDETAARKKLVIFNYIPEFDWIVASSSYLEEFYSPLETVRRIIFGTVLASLLVVLPVSFLISASITNPLRELMSCFAAGMSGQSAVRMQGQSQDELGQLARFFNSFMERLENFNSSLQNEVRERSQAEAALRNSEASYRLIAENVSDVIWVMDLDARRFRYHSPSVAQLRGLTPDQANALSLAESWTPSSLQHLLSVLPAAPAGPQTDGCAKALELEQRRHDRSTIWTEVTVNLIPDPEGRTVNVLGVSRDISARRQAEAALRESEERYRSVLDASPDPIVTYDTDGHVTFVNPAFTRLFGWTLAELRGGPHRLCP